jgi:jumonji domain-containing protein 2
VIPPEGYEGSRKLSGKELDNVVLKGPIEQNAYGRGGIYELLLI